MRKTLSIAVCLLAVFCVFLPVQGQEEYYKLTLDKNSAIVVVAPLINYPEQTTNCDPSTNCVMFEKTQLAMRELKTKIDGNVTIGSVNRLKYYSFNTQESVGYFTFKRSLLPKFFLYSYIVEATYLTKLALNDDVFPLWGPMGAIFPSLITAFVLDQLYLSLTPKKFLATAHFSL